MVAGDSSERLAMCKGTIGDKPWKQAGLINYDIGCKTHSVKVFFVPAVAKLMGSRFQGERVQFRLGFTLHDGYEAFDVSNGESKPLAYLFTVLSAVY